MTAIPCRSLPELHKKGFFKGEEFYIFLKAQSVDVKIEVILRLRHISTGTDAVAASLITFIVEGGIVSLCVMCVIPIREICSSDLGVSFVKYR